MLFIVGITGSQIIIIHEKIVVGFVVILCIIPGTIHKIIFSVELHQIPRMTALIRVRAGKAAIIPQLLANSVKRKGIALAHTFASYQCAVGRKGIIVIRHIRRIHKFQSVVVISSPCTNIVVHLFHYLIISKLFCIHRLNKF